MHAKSVAFHVLICSIMTTALHFPVLAFIRTFSLHNLLFNFGDKTRGEKGVFLGWGGGHAMFEHVSELWFSFFVDVDACM